MLLVARRPRSEGATDSILVQSTIEIVRGPGHALLCGCQKSGQPVGGQLIRDMSIENPLWGAPRIHGELLKLGIDVGQTTVAKYMARGRRPTSQGWKTFLHNHADGIASMDLFVVPTISFRLLYGLLIMHHDRRQILWLGVTAPPAAECSARQFTQAYGWKVAPSSVTATPSTVTSSSAAFGRWAFGIGQPPRDRRGRTGIVKGRSVRSAGNVLTTLSCSASGIFAICCDLTRPTITRLARTLQSTRTRRRREQYMPLVAFYLSHFLADFIICMCVFDFRQAQVNRDAHCRKRASLRFRFWHQTDMPPQCTHVRYWGRNGPGSDAARGPS